LLAGGTALAANIAITADAANSSTAYYGTSIANLLTDGFVYNEFDPTSTSPNLTYQQGFHGNQGDGSDVILSFTLDSAFTAVAGDTTIVLDAWGRDGYGTRDNDFDVVLYNGDYSTVIASTTGAEVDDATDHGRATITLSAGDTIDRFQIVGHNSSGQASNPFTLTEVRLARPTYVWNGSADGDWSNTVNWADAKMPVDDIAGTGNNSGLTMNFATKIVFDGTNLPSSNFPGIGGTHDGSNAGRYSSPTMVFNSGGTGTFDVVGVNDSFWVNYATNNTILTVGDGVGGGNDDVTVRIDAFGGTLSRHMGSNIHNFRVNSDGTLVFTGNLDFTSNAGNRWAKITIAGGEVVVSGYVVDLDNHANNVVDFTVSGGSFTAAYGGDYADITAVRNRLGIDFLNNTGSGNDLRAIDNGDSTFTVFEGYRWTGEAGDGDWNNTGNWMAGKIPLDDNGGSAGLTMAYDEPVTFEGTNLPSSNVPGIGGAHDNTNVGKYSSPTMRFDSGGTGSISVVAANTGFWSNYQADRTILTIGDGVGGGTEDVDLTLTGGTVMLNRHFGSITHNFLVNSDGTLRFSGNLDFSYQPSGRWGSFTLAGGDVVVSGYVNDCDNHANNFVEITAEGGTFTAAYGADYGNIAAVRNRLGTDFLNNAGGQYLKAVDNGSTFTVSEGYRWTGAAGDGDWSNTVNWVGGVLPVDTRPGDGYAQGLSIPYYDVIEFDGANLPSVNIPGLGGEAVANADTPSVVIRSGGTMNISVNGRESSFWSNSGSTRAIITVGDGVGGGTEDVTLNLTMGNDLSRHADNKHNRFVVNSDGTFNVTAGAALDFAWGSTRTSSFTIDGGTVVVNDPINSLTDFAGCYVEFTSEHGTFTAQYGYNFADIAAVQASLGTDFIDNTGVPEAIVKAIDNGDNTFTVTTRKNAGTVTEIW